MNLLQYVSNLSNNSLMSIFVLFIAIFLLFTIIIFIKDEYVFNKELSLLKDKPRFFTKFLGVLFILSLSYMANNWFVYFISIIIIATLVTELQFLEMLIALIWNRPQYIEGRFEELQKQQDEKETKSKLSEIEVIAEKTGEELRVEKAEKNQYLLFYHFERVYRLIFGSQIRILLSAEQNSDQISLPLAIMFYRDSGWNEKGYDAGNYTMFLLNMGLFTYKSGKMPEDCFYILTLLGKSFLRYLRENDLPLNKPF